MILHCQNGMVLTCIFLIFPILTDSYKHLYLKCILNIGKKNICLKRTNFTAEKGFSLDGLMYYHIDNSVLSNVPSVINFDNSHCEINSVISRSDFLPPKRHNFDINPPITEFNSHIENIDKF